jgi:hypothetical protein
MGILELTNQFRPLVYPYSGSGMLANEISESVIQKNAEECAEIAIKYASNAKTTFIDVGEFCDQMGCTNVESVKYDNESNKWVIKYRNGLRPDRFRHFHEAMAFIFLESSQD